MISIIVPVYNVEKYLSRCITSILAQTYEDFELILVDDGSTDSSGRICDEYEEKDSRIRVFHKENGGLSDARNFGLARMNGDYFCFVDSDDYVGINYLKVMMDMLAHHDADISIIKMTPVYDDEPVEEKSSDKYHVMDGKTAFYELVRTGLIGWNAWGKLMQKKLANDKMFPKGYYYEDLFTMPYLLEKSRLIVYSETVEYFYRQRQDSIMHVVTMDRMEMWEEGMKILLSFTSENYPECLKYVYALTVNGLFDNFLDNLLYSNIYLAASRHTREKYDYYMKSVLKSDCIGRKRKMNILLFLINSRAYRFIKKKWLKIKPDEKDRMNKKMIGVEM
ncbi:MAG: glycosyltransferase family 2 protein [Blautia sp.]|nr:glycosyltransferase family 2 protein [Blautia sp.]